MPHAYMNLDIPNGLPETRAAIFDSINILRELMSLNNSKGYF